MTTKAIEAGAWAIPDEAIDAALTAWRKDWREGPPEQDERSAMRAALEAAIASGALVPAKAVAEPVAWRWNGQYSNGPYTYSETEPEHHQDYPTEPLYTAPPSAKRAVAEMRERCAAKCDAVAKDWSGDADHFAQKQNFHRANVSLNHKNGAEECASKIRQLDTAPASGDYVVVPRVPTQAMIEAGCEANPTQWNEGTDLGFAADVANDVYRAMLNAASSNGDQS